MNFCQLLLLLHTIHLHERLQLLLHLFLDLCDYCQLQRQLLHFLVWVLNERTQLLDSLVSATYWRLRLEDRFNALHLALLEVRGTLTIQGLDHRSLVYLRKLSVDLLIAVGLLLPLLL